MSPGRGAIAVLDAGIERLRGLKQVRRQIIDTANSTDSPESQWDTVTHVLDATLAQALARFTGSLG